MKLGNGAIKTGYERINEGRPISNPRV